MSVLLNHKKKKEVIILFELSTEMIAQIREVRARKNITLSQASEQIGISKKTLGQIENEKIIQVQKRVYTNLTNWLVDSRKPN